MRNGWRRRARNALVYLTVRTLGAAVQMLPPRPARGLARLAGEGAFLADRSRRKRRAVANIRCAFPQLCEQEARAILRGSYRHLFESVVEAWHVGRWAAAGRAAEVVEMVGFELLEKVPQDRGVIFCTGHIGNWEAAGAAMPLLGHPLWSVARGVDNPLLDRYMRKLRSVTGQRVVPKRGALRHVLRLLRRGESVAFLIDQDARRHGVFVEFFGRPASTTPSPARLALKTGAPIVFGYGRRVPGTERIRICLTDLIIPDPAEQEDAEVLRITQRLTRDLEELVRRVPHEWLWQHKRWRTYPGKYPRSGS